VREKYFYLPKAASGQSPVAGPGTVKEQKGKYPCPCCGYITLPAPQEEAIAYICPVCFWENDVFVKSDDEPSDENHGMTLNEARENYRIIGACTEKMRIHVRKPLPEEYPS